MFVFNDKATLGNIWFRILILMIINNLKLLNLLYAFENIAYDHPDRNSLR